MLLRVAPELAANAPPIAPVGGFRSWLLLTAVATAVGLGVGYRLGLQTVASALPPTPVIADAALTSPPHSSPEPVSTRRATTDAAPTAQQLVADPVGALRSGAWSFEQLQARVRTDASVRADLWTRYRSAPDPLARETLLALLSAAPTAELAGYVATLVADPDPARRSDGYRLLTGLPIEDATLREHAVHALQRETDPRAMAHLVQGLQPGLLATEDAEPLARAMESLAQAGDPQVRAAALPGLAQWSERARLDPIYLAALGDHNSRVRAAAIAGIDASGVATPALRSALFQLAANPGENAEQRHSALLTLSRFRLTRAEVELFRMLQAELPVDGGEG